MHWQIPIGDHIEHREGKFNMKRIRNCVLIRIRFGFIVQRDAAHFAKDTDRLRKETNEIIAQSKRKSVEKHREKEKIVRSLFNNFL